METIMIIFALGGGVGIGMYIALQIQKKAVNTIQKGDKGDPGEKGIAGQIGLTGSKGETGEKGEQGIRGLDGERGPKGDMGISGIDGQDSTASNTSIQTLAKRLDVIDEALFALNKHINFLLNMPKSTAKIEEKEDESEKNRLGGGVRNWKRLE